MLCRNGLRRSGRPKVLALLDGLALAPGLGPDLGRGLDTDDLSLMDRDDDGAVLDGLQRLLYGSQRVLVVEVLAGSVACLAHGGHSYRSVMGVSNGLGSEGAARLAKRSSCLGGSLGPRGKFSGGR